MNQIMPLLESYLMNSLSLPKNNNVVGGESFSDVLSGINKTNLFKNDEVDRKFILSNSRSEKFKGDMVVKQPPNYSEYAYDNNISHKSKNNMTMDEYKQYFMNEMSKIPVSSYYRASFTGSLVIKEKAFEKMKDDPEYEKTVMNMLREMYSVKGLPQRSYCMQIIGASPEETYGYSVPMDSANSFLELSGDKKSWWQKRHEKMKELMEEQNNKYLEEKLEKQQQNEKEYAKQMCLNNYKMSQFLNTNINVK